MYAFVPSKTFPVQLSEADFLAIQNLYGLRNKSEIARPATTTVATTTIATRDTGDSADLCALRRVDAVLVLENRMYVAYRCHLWSVDLNGKSYGKSLLLTDYLRFLSDNFTRLAGAYRRLSSQLVLFVDDTVYMIEYPSFELVPGWPRKLRDMNLPPNAKINAVVNINAGRTFAIYNDEIVAESDDCSMITIRHNSLHDISGGYSTRDAISYTIAARRGDRLAHTLARALVRSALGPSSSGREGVPTTAVFFFLEKRCTADLKLASHDMTRINHAMSLSIIFTYTFIHIFY
ncbi:hypothetical protein P5V15_014375 [Pogonomyrmex californicus]